MARFLTLIRLHEEWTKAVQENNTAVLLNASRYVRDEWQGARMHRPNFNTWSLRDLRIDTAHISGINPKADKAELARIAEREMDREQSWEQLILQDCHHQLEQGIIPEGLIETWIYTLDMIW